MQSLTIKKGALTSDPLTLGHLQVATFFTPATETPFSFKIQGSIDGKVWGDFKCPEATAFTTEKSFLVHPVSDDIFEGIGYIRLKAVDKAPEEDIVVNLYIKNS